MRFCLLLAWVLLLAPATVRSDTVLLMAEEPGCVWCARWNEEIAQIYPKTGEGAAAPLRRFDIRTGVPEGVTLDRKVRYTPTFILVHDGKEQGRIEGYPGEDFFWGLLGHLMTRAQIKFERSG